jgi:ATP-dependent DNA helicase RecQ
MVSAPLPMSSSELPFSPKVEPAAATGAPTEPALTAVPSLETTLQERFGLPSFRPWQKEAIAALLEGPGRVLVVAPTGGGKSLTYQFPAAILPGTTLVLSPLVALMEDQVRSLEARGIAATYLASTLDLDERRRREHRFREGAYKLVYAAPERLVSEAFVELLSRVKLDLVAIDEAHCIAHWGHDFRPDYLRIGALLARLRPPRILACTATATPVVRAEIREALGLDQGPYAEVLRGFARPNLHLSARSVDGPKEARSALLALLKETLGDPKRARGKAVVAKGGAIVYAATRKGTEQWAAWLRERGYDAAFYHAGLDAEGRTAVANRFAAKELDIVVATNAFGMGIDRPDIRTVVHVQPPASIESYYQEVGRAGRDGDEAFGLLLCTGSDIALRRRMVDMGSDGAPSDPALAARAWSLFRELLRYIDARTCRHDFVLRYFGDEQELLGGCGHCDICEAIEKAGDDDAATGPAEEEVTLVVRKALSGIARARERAGLTAVADMLRGDDNERTRRFGFVRLSTFGILRGHPPEWVLALLRSLLAAGWVDLTVSDHPVPVLTRAGASVMRGETPARIVLPKDPRKARLTPRSKDEPRASSGAPLDVTSRACFDRLRAHRADIARQRHVPPYVVALDRTLIELATRRPHSLAELSGVYGMGPVRIEQYGAGFLATVQGD